MGKLRTLTDCKTDWTAFKDAQKRLGFTGKDIATGITILHDKKERFFCSCGESGAEYWAVNGVCPKCGGKLISFNTDRYSGQPSRRQYGIYENSAGKVCFVDVEMTVRIYSETEVGVETEENLHMTYDPTVRTFDYSPKPYRGWSYRWGIPSIIPPGGVKVAKKYFPEYFDSSSFKTDTSNGGLELYSFMRRLVIFYHLEETLTGPGSENRPFSNDALMGILTDALSRDDTRYKLLVDKFDWAWKGLKYPEQLLDIIEQLYSNPETTNAKNWWNYQRIYAADLTKFFDTDLGKLFLHRVRHGSSSLEDVAVLKSELDEKHYDDRMMELFLAFCKENADVYQCEKLLSIFNERVQWIRNNGIYLDEDTIRTRKFNAAYNVANFRKTLAGTDIEGLIQSDPLALIERIR